MIVDVDEMSRAIVAADETNQARAENLAMKVVAAQLLACVALTMPKEVMAPSAFVEVFKREGTNILLADGAFDTHPSLEVLRTQAVKALVEFCDPIAASLNQHQSSPSAAATSEDKTP